MHAQFTHAWFTAAFRLHSAIVRKKIIASEGKKKKKRKKTKKRKKEEKKEKRDQREFTPRDGPNK